MPWKSEGGGNFGIPPESFAFGSMVRRIDARMQVEKILRRLPTFSFFWFFPHGDDLALGLRELG
jgi:hypothetical protein